jgi:quercetin dioxygenase-like cupin family protein
MHFVKAGDGRQFNVLGGDQITIKATGAETDQQATVLETIVPPRGGPPRHKHANESETFYIVEGDFEFEMDGQRVQASTGDFLVAPRGVPHQFKNVGNEPGKLLIVCQPAGFEGFVEAFAQIPVDQPPDPAKMAEIGTRFGIEFLPPAK